MNKSKGIAETKSKTILSSRVLIPSFSLLLYYGLLSKYLEVISIYRLT